MAARLVRQLMFVAVACLASQSCRDTGRPLKCLGRINQSGFDASVCIHASLHYWCSRSYEAARRFLCAAVTQKELDRRWAVQDSRLRKCQQSLFPELLAVSTP
jgi:hypothetical protein